MTPLLEIEELRKEYAQRSVLAIAQLVIHEAKAYVLSGANGAGKSTLLRILCGLESAQTGTTRFMGQTVTLNPYPSAMREQIGYVHQHPVMFSTTVEANIAYGLKARRIPKHEIAPAVEAVLQWAQLGHLASRRADKLSGGEKQRVALARVKVLQPKLLLLDEPTANLDGQAREKVLELIPTLVSAGQSVVIASHDRDVINLPDTEILELREGRLIAGGSRK